MVHKILNNLKIKEYLKMDESKKTIRVNVNVEITPVTLEAIVENAKLIAGKDERGRYRVDTADKVSEMITKFMLEKDFESYVSDIDNFKKKIIR
jgi:hypothetical protein